MDCLSSLELKNVATDLESASLVILDVESFPQFGTALTALASAGLPVICLSFDQSLGALIRTLPLGGAAILTKPLDRESVLTVVDATLRRESQARALAHKYLKLRQLVRRVVRERRDINRRVELVCRDLVEAHRRLTYRVVELQQSRPAGP